MKPSLTHTPRRTVAAVALATCALTPATALARPIDDPTLPTRAAGSQVPASTSDLSTPVVTHTTPSAESNSDALPLVLSSAALLVAIGGLSVTVRRRQPPADRAAAAQGS